MECRRKPHPRARLQPCTLSRSLGALRQAPCRCSAPRDLLRAFPLGRPRRVTDRHTASPGAHAIVLRFVAGGGAGGRRSDEEGDMPAGSGSAVRTTLALFLAGGVIATLTFSRIALSDTVFTYDAAGHLLSVRNSETDPEACGNPPKTCRGDPHGDPVCAGGDCRLQCDPGWTDAGGRCADTSSDPTACGANLDVCPAPAHGAGRLAGRQARIARSDPVLRP